MMKTENAKTDNQSRLNSPRRSFELQVIRVIALFLVILGHSSQFKTKTLFGSYDYSSAFPNYSSSMDAINSLVDFIYTFHMPFFVLISGMAFGIAISSNKVVFGKDLIVNKFRRLLIPYILFGILWHIPIKLALGHYPINNLKEILLFGFGLGLDCGHLWFLMMLFFLFFIIALVGPRFKDWRAALVLSGICYAAALLIRGFHNYLNIYNALHMMIFFVFGCIITNQAHSGLHPTVSVKRILATLGVGVGLQLVNTFHFKEPVYLSAGLIWSAITAIAGISIAKFDNDYARNFWTFLDKHSFSVYLFHAPLCNVVLVFLNFLGISSILSKKGGCGAWILFFSRFLICFAGALFLSIALEFIRKRWSLQRLRNCFSCQTVTSG